MPACLPASCLLACTPAHLSACRSLGAVLPAQTRSALLPCTPTPVTRACPPPRLPALAPSPPALLLPPQSVPCYDYAFAQSSTSLGAPGSYSYQTCTQFQLNSIWFGTNGAPRDMFWRAATPFNRSALDASCVAAFGGVVLPHIGEMHLRYGLFPDQFAGETAACWPRLRPSDQRTPRGGVWQTARVRGGPRAGLPASCPRCRRGTHGHTPTAPHSHSPCSPPRSRRHQRGVFQRAAGPLGFCRLPGRPGALAARGGAAAGRAPRGPHVCRPGRPAAVCRGAAVVGGGLLGGGSDVCEGGWVGWWFGGGRGRCALGWLDL